MDNLKDLISVMEAGEEYTQEELMNLIKKAKNVKLWNQKETHNQWESARKRLEAQLQAGKKPEKINGKTTSKMVALNESDKKRINEQIEKLNK